MAIRGSFLTSGGNIYMLVRCETAPSRDANGVAIDAEVDGRYNLVNISTGKTRVSTPERLFLWTSRVDEVPIDKLRAHFRLPDLMDTGITASDVNFVQVVSEALASRQARTVATEPTMSADEILRAALMKLFN